MAKPQLGPHSQVLEAYWENNNLLSGKGSLKNWFLPQVKVAMVISGEFLVSVSSGLTSGRPRHLGGAGRSSRQGVGVDCWKSQGMPP